METIQRLAGYQRAALQRQAHHLAAVATVGKQGITEQVVLHVERELTNHELIKVRFSDFKEERRPLAEMLAGRTQAALVSVIGHVAILYRSAPDAQNRRIHLPERA
ncbi:MAG: YhbY family RNA-binding protein [Spirochaetaceae bacterium]|nr:MAG: YhbY family RNA-binding protein [Spirochaetaceae bacterium]